MLYYVFNSIDSKYGGDAEVGSGCTHVAGAGSRGQTTAPKFDRPCVLSPDADHIEST